MLPENNNIEAPTLSIVVPFYNTEEQYLRNCLEHLAQLSHKAVEVIIVDDGSASSSSNLLAGLIMELALDAKVFKKENGGQNSAREFGMQRARGKYLMFHDSDDYIDQKALAEVIDYLHSNEPSIIAFNYDVVNIDGDLIESRYAWENGFKAVGLQRLSLCSDSLCRQCYHLQRLRALPYALAEGLKIGEDLASCLSFNLSLGDCVAYGGTVYHYVERRSSISHNPPRDSLLDVLKAFDQVIENCGPYFSGCRSEVEWMAVLHVVFWDSQRIVDAIGVDVELKATLFDWMDCRFPDWRRNPYFRGDPVARKVSMRCLKHGWWHTYARLRSMRKLLTRQRPLGGKNG